MMRSEPEFDPSSKEINILGRRDAIVAIVASLLSVVVITVGSCVVQFGFVFFKQRTINKDFHLYIKLERPLYVEQTFTNQDNDVESVIYSPYVPCDLWGRIM